jgi:hypothetical protein
MRLTSAGTFSIGNTNSTYKLDVTGIGRFTTGLFVSSAGSDSVSAGANIQFSSNAVIQTNASLGLDFWMNNSGTWNRKVTFTNAGLVGIGTSSPGSILHVSSAQTITTLTSTTTTNPVELQFGNTTNYLQVGIEGSTGGTRMRGTIAYNAFLGSYENYGMTFHTYNENRMTITNGGQVLINRTSAASSEEVLGIRGKVNTTAFDIQIGTNSYYGVRFRNSSGTQSGSIQIDASSVTYGTSSDYRLKTDFKNYIGLDLISKIKTYDFAWKIDNTRNYGVIAHELQEVIPYAISGTKDAVNKDGSINPQGVDYSKIVPVLVKAIQEQQTQIEQLKAKLN